MKTIKHIIHKENPERYAIRYNLLGTVYLLLLQIDNEDKFILTETKETTRIAQPCKVLKEGYLDEFCQDNKAIDNGILLPDIALLYYFNNRETSEN